ncbi:D-amino acid dehydrogenase [Parvibium lacunae]|uniref:D-amino acid dehydrogenase n=1 Tax=Parvibium lacunae TaxID=1888893 RepID=A0A368L5L9_9BURK|nr:D-amino acid dehydrogenase [Parvibium lacunae]RCS58712.1 D-amino acid dehydrogenase [Parvibium lacunae]
MHIIILGAGVIGTTTAWYLRQAGHHVTVIERQAAPALETSYANGGQISVSHAEPWANPYAPLKVLQWLWQPASPLLFRPRLDFAQWQWIAQFFAECRGSRWRQNIQQLVMLGLYSRACLGELRAHTGIQYEALQRGILHFYTSRNVYQASAKTAALMRAAGCERELISVAEAIAIEPALQTIAQRIVGASYTAHDESGDARLFTERLAALAGQQGVVFRYHTTCIGWLATENQGTQEIKGIRVQTGEQIHDLRADAYVLSCGSYSQQLAAQLGLALKIYPAKGYSATFPILESAAVPSVSLTDDEYKIVFSRLGNRLRVAGTAEFNGFETSLNPRRCAPLIARTQELVGAAVDYQQAEFWTGLRPATPSNLPYIGPTPITGLYLNTGHGTLGWTHACGSAALLTSMIERQPLAIPWIAPQF